MSNDKLSARNICKKISQVRRTFANWQRRAEKFNGLKTDEDVRAFREAAAYCVGLCWMLKLTYKNEEGAHNYDSLHHMVLYVYLEKAGFCDVFSPFGAVGAHDLEEQARRLDFLQKAQELVVSIDDVRRMYDYKHNRAYHM